MSNQDIEKACRETIDANINMVVPWYLMAAYAYYVEDNPIIEDSTFDRMAKKILQEWDNITHRHKEYLDHSMLEAGTYLGEYPPQIEGALQSVRHTYRRSL